MMDAGIKSQGKAGESSIGVEELLFWLVFCHQGLQLSQFCG